MASITAVRFVAICAALSMLSAIPANAQPLRPNFYDKSCPNLKAIVATNVFKAIKNESRMAASLLRLHFHDCFVQGCDASILVDDDPRIPGGKGEKTANPNNNSVRGYELIDQIKADVESKCPNVVSCADIVTLAAYASIKKTGGLIPPSGVPLGRRDSLLPNFNLTTNLPGPRSTVAQLKQTFANVGLNVQDLVALSGGHTLGFSRCGVFSNRVNNFTGIGDSDATLAASFLASLKQTCPLNGDGNVLKNFDDTPATFDNQYFKDILAFRGILTTDQVLLTQASDTGLLVQIYARNQTKFFEDFAASMLKMSSMSSGLAGEIRRNCRKPNSWSLESPIKLVSDV